MSEFELPPLVSSAHLKGGCGKTTILTDLALLNAMRGKMVLALDMDRQGAMFANLTNTELPPCRPSQVRGHLQRLSNGEGLRGADTRYPEANKRLVVMHYPLEMFFQGSDHPEFIEGFTEIINREVQKVDLVLVDLPPARTVPAEVTPFIAMSSLVKRLSFLIVNRPNPKEIHDGEFCYLAFRELMTAQGIKQDKIGYLPVLNMHIVEAALGGYQIHFDPTGDTVRSVTEGEITTITGSPFDRLDQSGIRVTLPKIIIPIVPRSGKDLRHYSIFLDGGFNFADIASRPLISAGFGDDGDWCDWIYGKDMGIRLPDPLLDAYSEYLRAIGQISSTVFD